MEVVQAALEELSLEGLQGITFDGLWRLLDERIPKLQFNIDKAAKKYIWNQIKLTKELSFYDGKFDTIALEQAKELNPDGQPFLVGTVRLLKCSRDYFISDTKNEVRGYCTNYNTRKNVTEDVREMIANGLSWEEVNEKFEHLHIVVSQALRHRTIVDVTCSPSCEIGDFRYTLLEIIGQTRQNGFFNRNFTTFGIDPRSTFFQIKMLLNSELLTKQAAYLDGKVIPGIAHVLQLARFRTKLLTKVQDYGKDLCDLLLNEPNYSLSIFKLRDHFGDSLRLKKTRQWLHQLGHIRYLKEDGEEVPSITATTKFDVQLVKVYNPDTEFVIDDATDYTRYVPPTGDIDMRIMREIPVKSQVLSVIERMQEAGIDLKHLCHVFNVPLYMIRSFVRQLLRTNLIKQVVVEEDKKKFSNVIATKYLHQNKIVQSLQAKTANEMIADSLTNKCQSQPNTITIQSTSSPPEEGIPAASTSTAVVQSTVLSSSDQIQQNTLLAKTLNINDRFTSKQDSLRKLSRLKFIADLIETNKIIEGSTAIHREIKRFELSRDDSVQCCVKTVPRLLKRLEKDNRIIKRKVVFSMEVEPVPKPRTVFFYCSPSVQRTDEIYIQTIEEYKSKMLAARKHKHRFPVSDDEFDNQLTDTDTEDEAVANKKSYDKVTTNSLGYLPRFPRVRSLHFFLWQFVYGSKEDCVEFMKSNDTDGSAIGDNYRWLAKVGKPRGIRSEGSCTVGNLIDSMSIGFIAQVIGIRTKSKTLNDYLADPHKRLLRLNQLPRKLYEKLAQRKEKTNRIDGLVEGLVILTKMGLLCVENAYLPKTRRMITVQVGKLGILLDTVSSQAAYSQTVLPSGMTSFPEIRFEFERMDDLFRYWQRFHLISVSTPLGKERNNEALLPCLSRPHGSFRAMILDKQFEIKVHGDKRGAAGFDTSFFTHYLGNWSWRRIQKNEPKVRRKKFPKKLGSANDVPIKKQLKIKMFKGRGSRMGVSSALKVSQALVRTARKTRKPIATKIMPIKRRQSRYRFSKKEDHYIILALVAATLLQSLHRTKYLWDHLWQVMMKESKETRTKCKQALCRRGKLLKMTDKEAISRVKSFVGICHRDKKFCNSIPKPRDTVETVKYFPDVYAKVLEKLSDGKEMDSLPFDFPLAIADLKANFDLEMPWPKMEDLTDNRITTKTIRVAGLKDMILNCIRLQLNKNKQYNQSIAFKYFGSVIQSELEDAIKELRKKFMITKWRPSLININGHHMSKESFSISFSHDRLFHFAIRSSTLHEIRPVFKELRSVTESVALSLTKDTSIKMYPNATAGWMAFALNGLINGQVSLDLSFPDDVVNHLSKNGDSQDEIIACKTNNMKRKTDAENGPAAKKSKPTSAAAQSSTPSSTGSEQSNESHSNGKRPMPLSEIDPSAPVAKRRPVISIKSDTGCIAVKSRHFSRKPQTNSLCVDFKTETEIDNSALIPRIQLSNEMLTNENDPNHVKYSRIRLLERQYGISGFIDDNALSRFNLLNCNPCQLSMDLSLRPFQSVQFDPLDDETDLEMLERFKKSEANVTNGLSISKSSSCERGLKWFVSMLKTRLGIITSPQEESVVIAFLKKVNMARQPGLTYPKAKDCFRSLQTVHTPDLCFDDVINAGINFGLLFSVGIQECRIVAAKHALPWFASLPQKASPSEDLTQQRVQNNTIMNPTIMNDMEESKEIAVTESAEAKESNAGKSTASNAVIEEEEDTPNEIDRLQSTEAIVIGYKQKKKKQDSISGNSALVVKYRPWILFDGSLNPTTLRKFQESILTYVISHPGCQKNAILRHFHHAIRGADLSDILDFLCASKCIIGKPSIREQKITLFSSITDYTDLPYDLQNPHYFPTADCMLTFTDCYR